MTGLPDPSVTMDSREIAELTGKEHRNVCRDIEEMLGKIGEGVLRFEQTYQNEQNGQTYRCFKLPGHELMLLLTGYSVPLRDKVLRRWEELENAQPKVEAPKGAHLLALAVIEAQRMIEAKDAEIAALAPRAAVADTIANSHGLKPLRTFGVLAKIGANKIFERCASMGIIYRDKHSGEWIVKSEYRDYLLMVEEPYAKGGETHIYSRIFVTGRGETWLAGKLRAEAIV